MSENEEKAQQYLNAISRNYEKYKKLWFKAFNDNYPTLLIEDKLQDTIIKCYEIITKNGISDVTDDGFLNYTFKALRMNLRREQLYARNAYYDANVNVFDYLDNFDNGDGELEQKINLQHYNDFSVVYILKKLEQNTDITTFSVFRLYYLLPKMTYQKLKELTNVKDAKKRVLEAREWLQNNITESEIKQAFKKYQEENE